MSIQPATLYCVATPIGNLDDLTGRAMTTLQSVQCIYAEDTRVTQRLLTYLGIQQRLVSLHDFNEEQRIESVLVALKEGQSLALVSDAGTPLISDPGYKLVRAVTQAGFTVIPIPGVSALITALSAAGLPTDRFSFEGFLPAKSSGRVKILQSLAQATQTLVFYESCHRISDTLADMVNSWGAEREAVIARELTKLYETFYRATLGELLVIAQKDDNMRRGELVLIVAGYKEDSTQTEALSLQTKTVLTMLLDELPVKQATRLAARLTGQPKNELYRLALTLNRS